MSTKLSAGKASRTGDSNAQFLGLKKSGGQSVKNGDILIRQRGSSVIAGKGVRTAQDFTLYSVTSGKVSFSKTRKTGFNNKVKVKKVINITE